MEPVRIGAALPPLVESEAAGPEATKPEAPVASAPKSTATGNEGQLFQPSAGDEVLVSFEHGDPRAPILTGALWNVEAPPTSGTSETSSQDHRLSEEGAKLLEHQLRNLK